MQRKRNERTFFFSSQSSFSMIIFSLSGCSSCNNVLTSSRIVWTTFDECVTKREMSIGVALVISFNGFTSSGKPSVPISSVAAKPSAGIYNVGCWALSRSSVDAISLYSIWIWKWRNKFIFFCCYLWLTLNTFNRNKNVFVLIWANWPANTNFQCRQFGTLFLVHGTFRLQHVHILL